MRILLETNAKIRSTEFLEEKDSFNRKKSKKQILDLRQISDTKKKQIHSLKLTKNTSENRQTVLKGKEISSFFQSNHWILWGFSWLAAGCFLGYRVFFIQQHLLLVPGPEGQAALELTDPWSKKSCLCFQNGMVFPFHPWVLLAIFEWCFHFNLGYFPPKMASNTPRETTSWLRTSPFIL